MAKSKYLTELEDFKKKLPEVLLKHAEINGLDLCTPGLEGFFEEMGIEWEPERAEYHVSISFKLNLPDSGDRYSLTDAGDTEVGELIGRLESFLTNEKHYIKRSLSFEEAYQY